MKITFTRFKLLYRVYIAAQKITLDEQLKVQRYIEINKKALAQAVQELKAYEAKQLVATWSDGTPRTQRPSK